MANKRKKAASSRKTPTKYKKTQTQKAESSERSRIAVSVILCVVGIIFTALSFMKGENVAGWVHQYIQFGIFGIGGWLIGPLFLYWGILVGLGQEMLWPVLKGLFLLLTLSGTMLVFGPNLFLGNSLADHTFSEAMPALLQASSNTRFGCGLLSAVLGWTSWRFGGLVFARVLLVIMDILAIMFLTNITPADLARFFHLQYKRRAAVAKEQRVNDEMNAEMNTSQLESNFGTYTSERSMPENPLANAPSEPFVKAPQGGEEAPDILFDGEAVSHGAAFDPLGVRQSESAGEQLDVSGMGAAEAQTENVAPTNMDATVEAMIDKAAVQPDDKAEQPEVRGEQDLHNIMPYRYPPITLFQQISDIGTTQEAKEEMRCTAEKLTHTLSTFGVQTKIMAVTRGPAVTRYEIKPQEGVKISKITSLADDIALNLAADGVRIEAPIPGKPAVGIEVPNAKKSAVGIRAILESAAFVSKPGQLGIALGKDITGNAIVADLASMPHLLVAGSTGSGKSVCINATIMSFLYRFDPSDLRLILIDPKIVELAEYKEIPHLLMPVVTDARKAAGALGAAVNEMERRYRLFADNNVRDFKTYNKLAAKTEELEKIPYVVIVIDELADLMMVAGKDVETYICRIAQKARAAGMHLIVATQRPSVDVITGLIKANIPSRIAFAVSSQVDSRTILDSAGAEKLLGMGDMLFMPVGANKPVRVQGTYVKDKEITEVVEFIKRNGTAHYDEDMINEMEKCAMPDGEAAMNGPDDSILSDLTFNNAVNIAFETGQVSTSFLQRRLRLGYARAGRLVDGMERYGIVSQAEGSKPRKLLMTRDEWLELSMNAKDRG